MNPLRPPRVWLRAHPLAADSLLAAAILLALLVIRPEDAGSDIVTADGWGRVLVVAAVAPLTLRRRWPVAVWGLTVAMGGMATFVAGGPSPVVLPTLVSMYTVSVWRGRAIAVAAALGTVVCLGLALLSTGAGAGAFLSPGSYALLAWGGMATAVGIAVRGQRSLLHAAQERALVAEQTREDEAQRRVTEERLRIARELHDVVAHQIALINVQAGVARHLLDSQPAQAAEALGHVREASALVLSELATILGLLRTAEDPLATAPVPGLDQVDALVEAMRRAGLVLTWRVVGAPRPLPPGVDLAAYRIVQEALTNAHKHGQGQADVTLRYEPSAVDIAVSNPVGPQTRPGHVAGHGLVGMAERVAAAGGRLTFGPSADGAFGVHASLPAEPKRGAGAQGDPEPAAGGRP